jgi:RimJ/RimL family protein N-acetyltransferase
LRTFTNNIPARIKQLLTDTPDNEPVYFAALRKQGRFWVDNPKDPSLLFALTGGLAPVCHVRKIGPGGEKNCLAALKKIRPAGALAGDETLIGEVYKPLGYADPSTELVFGQHGRIRLTEPGAETITRYDRDQFEFVDAQAPWIWDAYGSPPLAMEEFPAFAETEDGRIVAIAAVYSHSLKWAEICYWVHDDFRNKGSATKCAASLTAYLNERGFSVTASTDESHEQSLSVMKKLGMTEFSRRAICPPQKSS